jgi:hypothetical protein
VFRAEVAEKLAALAEVTDRLPETAQAASEEKFVA